jgi:uncharacterized protein
VFNPLSVLFVSDPLGALETVIYEVNNTFGERRCYVVPAGAPSEAGRGGVYGHGCAKELFVSPFTDGQGRYSFRTIQPIERALIAVLYRDAQGPVLRAHFAGTAEPMTDAALLRALARFPLMTAKIVGAIHLEAAKLWLKGVPLARRHKSPRYAASRASDVVGLPNVPLPQVDPAVTRL